MSSIQIVRHVLGESDGLKAMVQHKIFPTGAPQTTLAPFVVLNIVGRKDEQTLAGASGYFEGRIQFEALAETVTEASDMADFAMAALGDVVKRQDIPGFRDVDIYFADTETTDNDDKQTMYRHLLQFRVRYRT